MVVYCSLIHCADAAAQAAVASTATTATASNKAYPSNTPLPTIVLGLGVAAGKLAVAKEFNAIREGIRNKCSNDMRWLDANAFKPSHYTGENDVGVHLTRYKPKVLHVAAHHSPEKGIEFASAYMPDDQFVAMIKIHMKHQPDILQLVVLNCCFSQALAEQLYKAGVPVVIGTTGRVPDAWAVAFSTTFYAHLAVGSTFSQALDHARSAVEFAELPQGQTADPDVDFVSYPPLEPGNQTNLVF